MSSSWLIRVFTGRIFCSSLAHICFVCIISDDVDYGRNRWYICNNNHRYVQYMRFGFIDVLWSPAGKGLTSWLSFVMSNCDVVTFPLVSWVSSQEGGTLIFLHT